jgi:hypothetical protein
MTEYQMSRADPNSLLYVGKIEGETFNDTFKAQIKAYLGNPEADKTAPTIRIEVGYEKFFMVIGYLETRYRHFYPSIFGSPKDAVYPRENSGGDGGFGVMQFTNPVPKYKQIWHYKQNIDGGVELIRDKLTTARAYPEIVRKRGCTKQPYINKKGNWVYPCRPLPVTEKIKMLKILTPMRKGWMFTRSITVIGTIGFGT